MAYASFDGAPLGLLGFDFNDAQGNSNTTIDAANEGCVMVGHVFTSDGSSHTIDTSGSSSLQWRTNAVTFANGGTTVKVGLGTVDASNGPPGRITNAAGVFTFDVSADFTGGGGGITGTAWQTSVPTTGTKTIAHNDLVAFAVQMTARGGADSVTCFASSVVSPMQRPNVTSYTSGSFSALTAVPRVIISFSDGALGYFYGGIVQDTSGNVRTWNSGSSPSEYGQLFDLPFPVKVYGLYGIIDPDADCDLVLYSDPLGTPVAEKTYSFDSNTGATANFQRIFASFTTPYSVAARQKVAAIYKPGGSNISTKYLTLANAAHRVAFPWGTHGYGVSRSSGAFADANSSLDHYYIGLLVGAYDDGASAGGGGMIVHPGMNGRLAA